MRIIAGAAAVALCIVFLQPASAHAVAMQPEIQGPSYITKDAEFQLIALLQSANSDEEVENKEESEQVLQTKAVESEPPVKKKPKTHVVQSGDTLSDIAKQHDVYWKRIYNKNKQLNNPDVLNIGQRLVIPEADEELKDRKVSRPEPVAAVVQPSNAPAATTVTPASTYTQPIARGSSSGNTYFAGYCTWYAKNRRPDLPNNLGNADTWAARAAAQGYATGSTPRVGAIGQQGMHVVYVESVNANGTVTVSEMNYNGWNVISSRTVPASTFYYIY